MESNTKGKIIGGLVAFAALAMLTVFNPLTQVSNGTVGVVTLGGKADQEILTPGWHIVNPFVNVHELSTQPVKAEAKGEAASKDLQAVHTSMAVNYKLNPAKAVVFYTTVGEHAFEDRILAAAAQDAFKTATSQYRAEELISQREQVREKTLAQLTKSVNELTGGSVLITEVFFTNFGFNPSFTQAIEAAVTAEKQALAEKNKLAIIEYQAQQAVKVARGQAESMAQVRQQATPEYLKLRELEVEMARVQKWNGVLPQQMFSGTPTAFMNVGK